MENLFLTKTLLFRGISEEELEGLLHCLDARTRTYEKGEIILRTGETVDAIGMVLSGGVNVESDDIWGNSRRFSYVEPGRLFAEICACLPGEPMLVQVTADEKTEILFLNAARMQQPCARNCPAHQKLVRNLLNIFARKSLALARRVLNISSRSIRGKLLTFLSQQAVRSGSCQFTIPFDRQELADYLGVDRSALCNELSKMRCEGILTYKKNTFLLQQPLLPAGLDHESGAPEQEKEEGEAS